MAALIAFLLAVEAGTFKVRVTVDGPFNAEQGRPRVVWVPVPGGNFLWTARSDGMDNPTRSRLRLWVNGKEYLKPHTPHSIIRSGAPGTFSHWSGSVVFALPDGAKNNPQTHVTFEYPVQLASPWLTVAGLILLGAVWLEVERPALTSRRIGRLFAVPALAALGIVWLLFFASVAYLAVTLWAWANGWALPTIAAIRLFPFARNLAMVEPYFPFAVIVLAVCGLISSWIVVLLKLDVGPVAAAEAQLKRALGWLGLPIAIAVAVLSISALWAGLSRPGDTQYMSILGLVPYSDASGYYLDINNFVRDGVFSFIGILRPFATATRLMLYALSGFSYAQTLVVQTILVVAAAFGAAVAVQRWRGVWAAIIFFAMTYAVGREFFPTFLTESLGLFWALLSLPLLIWAIRFRSIGCAIGGVVVLLFAMLTRMGAMFTPPALALWILLNFGRTFRVKCLIGGATAVALIAAVLLNFGVSRIYTAGPSNVGGNFAYSACGITLDGNWITCQDRYRAQLAAVAATAPTYAAQYALISKILYRKALENFEANPGLSFRRLGTSTQAFIKWLPITLVEGYTELGLFHSKIRDVFLVLVVIGLLIWAPRTSRHENSFWVLFWASTFASAAVIYADDGRRVMMASYPLIALFFVSILRIPSILLSDSVKVPVTSPRAIAGIVGALIILISVGPSAVHLLRPKYFHRNASDPNERIVFGGSRMTGVLVLADSDRLPTSVPAIHLSNFEKIVRQSGVEDEQKLVTPSPPKVPFGFIAAPSREDEPSILPMGFIVPPAVLSQRDVATWRFELANPKDVQQGPWWYTVKQAYPLSSGR